MGLLDQLWDDTVAGPRPEAGLGKLRKYSSFSSASSAAAAGGIAVGPNITRSITIIRTPLSSATAAASSPRSPSASSDSAPSSPAAAPPDSPFAPPTPRGGWKSPRRKPTNAAAEGPEKVGPRSPNVYDWVVISSLDR